MKVPGAEGDPAVMARGPADVIDASFTPEIAALYAGQPGDPTEDQ